MWSLNVLNVFRVQKAPEKLVNGPCVQVCFVLCHFQGTGRTFMLNIKIIYIE